MDAQIVSESQLTSAELTHPAFLQNYQLQLQLLAGCGGEGVFGWLGFCVVGFGGGVVWLVFT